MSAYNSMFGFGAQQHRPSQAEELAYARARMHYDAQAQANALYEAAALQQVREAMQRSAAPPTKPAGPVIDLVQNSDGVWHEPAALGAPR